MRINLPPVYIISCVIFFSIINTRAIAQTQTDQLNANPGSHTQLSPSYGKLPGGSYLFLNAANGHTSDIRASKYVTNTTSQEVQNAPAISGSNTHTNAVPVQAATDGNSGFHLQLTQDANTDNYAQTGVYFMIGASDKYSVWEDAVQINGPGASVFLSSFTSDNVDVCINTMSDYANGKRIRLLVYGTNSGQYTLSFADMNEIDTASYNLYLVDNQQKDSVNLVHGSYTFNINPGDTSSFGAYRFVLSVQHKPVPPYSLSSFSGQKVASGVQLSWATVNAGNYTGFTLQKLNNDGSVGDSLYAVQSDSGVNTYDFIDIHPTIGNNVYRLLQNGITGNITYSNPVTVGYNNSLPNNNLTLYPNPAVSTMNASFTSGSASTASYAAYIYNSMGGLVKHEAVAATTWTEDVSSYRRGVYFIQVKDNNGNIIAQSKFVKAE